MTLVTTPPPFAPLLFLFDDFNLCGSPFLTISELQETLPSYLLKVRLHYLSTCDLSLLPDLIPHLGFLLQPPADPSSTSQSYSLASRPSVPTPLTV